MVILSLFVIAKKWKQFRCHIMGAEMTISLNWEIPNFKFPLRIKHIVTKVKKIKG